MDEQRRQAYLNFIQHLINSPNGEEIKILKANSDLVDTDFIKTLLEVAENWRLEGYLNESDRLFNIAGYLLGVYDQVIDSSALADYSDFLMQVLRAVAENPKPESIYPLLKKNIHKLDGNFQQILVSWTTQKFSQVKSEKSQSIAIAYHIGNFCTLLQEFPLSNRGNQLEIVITGYHLIQQIFTQADFPIDWTMIQNNLAAAYSQRIRGDKAENLEVAIASYHAALQVRTQANFPIECLQTGRSLGDLALKIGNYPLAIETYNKAIAAVEISRNWSTFSDERRSEILEKAINVYFNLVQAYIKDNQLDQAIETVERSRSKRLIDFISVNDLYKGGEKPPEILEYLQQYETLEKQINARRLPSHGNDTRELAGTRNSVTSVDLDTISQQIAELET